MTIQAFNALNLRSKLLTLRLKGQLLDESITKSGVPYIICHYSLDKCFVQILFNLETHKITKIEASENAKYLDQHSHNITSLFESDNYKQQFEFTLKK